MEWGNLFNVQRPEQESASLTAQQDVTCSPSLWAVEAGGSRFSEVSRGLQSKILSQKQKNNTMTAKMEKCLQSQGASSLCTQFFCQCPNPEQWSKRCTPFLPSWGTHSAWISVMPSHQGSQTSAPCPSLPLTPTFPASLPFSLTGPTGIPSADKVLVSSSLSNICLWKSKPSHEV